MTSQNAKARTNVKALLGMTTEDWDNYLRDLASEWEVAFANRQIQAKREGNKSPPPVLSLSGSVELPAPAKIESEPGSTVTVNDLFDRYLTDAGSPYSELRHSTKGTYKNISNRLRNSCGPKKLSDLRSDDLHRLYDGWTATTIPLGNAMMTVFRLVVGYGASGLRNEDCERLTGALKNFKFKTPPRGDSQPLTVDQASAIRAKAKTPEWGSLFSVALAQAFQFDFALRSKEIIGEWVPEHEKGESTVIINGKKWLYGLRWEEIDSNFILTHGKSYQQEPVKLDIKSAAMVVEELDAKYPGFLSDRALLPLDGPIIVSEKTGKPWSDAAYRRLWRLIAANAGITVKVKKVGKRGSAADDDFEISETAETEVPAVRH